MELENANLCLKLLLGGRAVALCSDLAHFAVLYNTATISSPFLPHMLVCQGTVTKLPLQAGREVIPVQGVPFLERGISYPAI
jgi:hypothetical protein